MTVSTLQHKAAPTPNASEQNPVGRRWFGYLTSRGSIRAKLYIDDPTARQTTKKYIEWCEGYIYAHTPAFHARNRMEAIEETQKLLATKLVELKKRSSVKPKAKTTK